MRRGNMYINIFGVHVKDDVALVDIVYRQRDREELYDSVKLLISDYTFEGLIFKKKEWML